MVTTNSTLKTAIAATTLRIVILRLIRILSPLCGWTCVMSLVGNILQLRVLLPTPWLTLDRISLTLSNVAHLPSGHFWNIEDTRLRS